MFAEATLEFAAEQTQGRLYLFCLHFSLRKDTIYTLQQLLSSLLRSAFRHFTSSEPPVEVSASLDIQRYVSAST